MRKILTVVVSGILVGLTLASVQANSAAGIESSGIGALPAHPRADNARTKSIFVYDDATSDNPITDGIKVINNTDSTKTIAVYPVDSQPSSDGAFACAQKVDPRTQVGSWIKLATEQVTVSANSSEIVPFTLTVPEEADAGEHNGCIAVQDVVPSTAKTDGVVLNFRSALRVAVTTPGSLNSDLHLVDIQSRSINQTTFGVSPIVKNTGNVSADAHISVALTGVLGTGYRFSSTSGQFPIFPGLQSRFNFELEKPFWGGWYNRDVEVSYRQPLASGQLSDDVTNIRAAALVFIEPQPLALLIEIAILIITAWTLYYWIRRHLRLRLRLKLTESYTVQSGDTIESVAERFEFNWQELASLNSIKAPYILDVGQIIRVPSSRPPARLDSSSSTPQSTQPPLDKRK